MTSFEFTNQFADVTSEVVNWVHYNKNTRVLAVTTLNGSTYMYADVSENTYKNFLAAPSRGSFWNYNIKQDFKRTPLSKNGALSNVQFINVADVSHYKAPATTGEDFATHKPTTTSNSASAVELNGNLTIKGTAPTGDAAIAQITKTLNENFKGTFKVKSLTQTFE